jgi:hypothetical protein
LTSAHPTTLSMIIRSLEASFALAVALVTICRGLAYGAESRLGVLELDPSKTLVEFKLGGSLHATHGRFQLKRGTIKVDDRTDQAEGEIVVDAATGKSGNFLRDNRMRDSVLQAARWPEIMFRPQRVDGHIDAQGNFRAKLVGVLILQGAQHDAVIETRGTLSGREVVATGHISIPYVEWGLKDPSVLFLSVAKQVEIDIATAGHVTGQVKEAVSEPTHHVSPAMP